MGKNILFFMTDQFLWNALGYAGHPILRTPNLDRLAAKSVNFPNTFCVSPICVPARISLFSGQYPHKHGQTNNLPVREGTKMFIETLNENGYHTAAMGKLHLMPHKETERFKTLKLHDGYSRKGTSAYVRFLEKERPEYAPSSMHGYPKEGMEGVIFGKNVLNKKKSESIMYGTSKVPSEFFYTQWLSDESIRFLDAYDDTAPFFLFVSFLGPHSPFFVPEPYDKMYDPQDVILPKTVEEDLASKPKSQQFHRNMWGMGVVSEQQLRKITALYYAHISLIDEHIGRVLHKLDERGFSDNTIIVFTTDHGELLGSHGLFYKGLMYEEAMRIPLLIHDANNSSGKVTDGLVSQIDIMPTVMDLAGVPVPEWSQGKSMKGLMSGDMSYGRREVFAEISQLQKYGNSPGYKVGCRDENFLFAYEMNTHYDIFEGELYDLRNDPEQRNNLYHQPEHAGMVVEFKERLLNWFMATQ